MRIRPVTVSDFNARKRKTMNIAEILIQLLTSEAQNPAELLDTIETVIAIVKAIEPLVDKLKAKLPVK